MSIKKYKHTWFNGMLEDPKGEWVKEKDACKFLDYWINICKTQEKIIETNHLDWLELHRKHSDNRILSLLLTAGLLSSVFFNIIQFLL